MKATWLGQAGFLFEHNGKTIMVDPYFSDSVGKRSPEKHRRVPMDERYLTVRPDLLILTHDHLDHTDPETLEPMLKQFGGITVLAPRNSYLRVREYGGMHNYVEFNRYTEWTEYGFRFRAVYAAHSDPLAIGVIIETPDDGKIYYVTGDTLYNRAILDDLPESIDVMFVPVNGVGNNMNATDAERFSRACRAKWTVPCHVGMFDSLTPEIYSGDNRLVLQFYKEKEI